MKNVTSKFISHTNLALYKSHKIIILFSHQSIRPFCNNIPNIDDESISKYECNSNRDAVLLCNLMRYHHPIPYNYRVILLFPNK